MNLTVYHPLYDLYNDYLSLLFAEGLKGEILYLTTEVPKEERFDTTKLAGDKLSHYVSSLASEYHDLTLPTADTKPDYYKTSLKTLLAQLLSATKKIHHKQRESYLK